MLSNANPCHSSRKASRLRHFRQHFAERFQPNQLAVLWVIQTYAGANADCWPSIKTIADGACVSVRTARAVAGQLESIGLLQRESRRNDRGGLLYEDLYRVTVNHLANVAPPSLDPPAARAGVPRH